MNFFDIEGKALPRDGEYYFNILVITIGFQKLEAAQEIWYLNFIKLPRPVAICCYEDAELRPEEIEVNLYPNSVVEVSSLGVVWYEMISYDTNDFWDLEDVAEVEEEEEEEEYDD